MHLTNQILFIIIPSQYKINFNKEKTDLSKYNYNISAEITCAMSKHNKIMPGSRFSTIDGNILSLVRSFARTDTKFYMSNKQLAEIMIADPSTIQRSIDKLITAGLLTKEIIYIGPKPQRLLTYQEDAVKKLLELN
jgi:hypothetical protein